MRVRVFTLYGLLAALVLTVTSEARAQQIPETERESLAADLTESQLKISDAIQKYVEAQARFQSSINKSPDTDLIIGMDTPARVENSVGKLIKVTNPAGAPIYTGATNSAAVAETAPTGKALTVTETADGFYATSYNGSVGWVSDSDVTPLPVNLVESWVVSAQEEIRQAAIYVMDTATSEAIRLRDAYATNQYFFVQGFTIELSVPPGASLNFEFRQPALPATTPN